LMIAKTSNPRYWGHDPDQVRRDVDHDTTGEHAEPSPAAG
jgi:hypothetical protein